MSALEWRIEEVLLLNPPFALNHDTRRIACWYQPVATFDRCSSAHVAWLPHPSQSVQRDRAMRGNPYLCRVHCGDASRKGQDHAHRNQSGQPSN
jgi:hypothetical protein